MRYRQSWLWLGAVSHLLQILACLTFWGKEVCKRIAVVNAIADWQIWGLKQSWGWLEQKVPAQFHTALKRGSNTMTSFFLSPRSNHDQYCNFEKNGFFSPLCVQQKIHFSTGIFSGQLTRNELEDVIHYSHLTLYRQCQKKFHAISTFYTTASDELMTKQ